MLDQHTVLYTHSDQFSPRFVVVVVLQYPAPTVPELSANLSGLFTAHKILQIPFAAGIVCLTSDVISRHVICLLPATQHNLPQESRY
jgi:hypothetical protein